MTQRQIKLMKDLGATILACTPSFAVYLAETMAQEGIDPSKDLKLKIGMFGAEPWSDKIRERIENDMGIEAYDVYGLTELCGPGVSIECPVHNGFTLLKTILSLKQLTLTQAKFCLSEKKANLSLQHLAKQDYPC